MDAIEALCLKSTTSLTTTLDNANKLFIGNASNIGCEQLFSLMPFFSVHMLRVMIHSLTWSYASLANSTALPSPPTTSVRLPAAFGAICVRISAILRVSADGNSLFPGDLPDYFATQTWSLPAWQPIDPSVTNQTVILNIVNNGASSLTLSGIDFKLLGLPDDFSVEPGKKKKIKVQTWTISTQIGEVVTCL